MEQRCGSVFMTDAESDKSVILHYIKGSAFRTVHVDGALGVASPSGHVHCSVYSERPAIPRTVRHRIDSEGEILDEGETIDGREGYVRELEVDLVMSEAVARALADWLLRAADRISERETSDD